MEHTAQLGTFLGGDPVSGRLIDLSTRPSGRLIDLSTRPSGRLIDLSTRASGRSIKRGEWGTLDLSIDYLSGEMTSGVI